MNPTGVVGIDVLVGIAVWFWRRPFARVVAALPACALVEPGDEMIHVFELTVRGEVRRVVAVVVDLRALVGVARAAALVRIRTVRAWQLGRSAAARVAVAAAIARELSAGRCARRITGMLALIPI